MAVFSSKLPNFLTVDDETIIRMLIVELIHELGYTAIEAADGASDDLVTWN